jgi:hypothetical protein
MARWTSEGDCRVPWDRDADDVETYDQPTPYDDLCDQMPLEERGMSQPSGVFPALYDGIGKKKPKPPRKPKR